ncbi:c-type cytochrome [Legionella fairfieldensis]|uniref:c-type cytochrome n=1 Tax=Legionella fairfieldensis TaxID=45064 RepID=UPI00048C9877|nr:c-type cytochrome [Legionella fairfieldensis]
MKKFLFIVALFNIAVLSAAKMPDTGGEKVILCTACHGQEGYSTNPQWPHLAGQHANYLLKQLEDFKKGTTRNAATMTALVANLSQDEMLQLASFYARQPLPQGTTPRNYVQRGERLYRGGDFAKHITACIACHGPRGTGNAQAGFPVLSGQNAAYTIQQLQAFKENKRTNDLNSIMRDISARMSEEDMEAVAYYIQGLH